MLKQLKDNLQRARNIMQRQANKERRDVEFSVGDRVFLKVRLYRQTSMGKGPHHKLLPKFYGPFLIEARIGEVAYRLQLPPHSRIHPVFHVSQLKRVVGNHPVVHELPESLEIPLDVSFEPEEVMASRINSGADGEVEEILVKWMGKPMEESTWVDRNVFQRQFPYYHFEDKVDFKGEGVDVMQVEDGDKVKLGERESPLPVWRVYCRRGTGRDTRACVEDGEEPERNQSR